MSNCKRGVCSVCSKPEVTLVAREMCWKCYKLLVPQSERKKKVRKPKPTSTDYFPRKIMIPTWETSDGKEHGCEVTALKHQLDIERTKLLKAKGVNGYAN